MLAYPGIHPAKPLHVTYACLPYMTKTFYSILKQIVSLRGHSLPKPGLRHSILQNCLKKREPQSFKPADVFNSLFYCSAHILKNCLWLFRHVHRTKEVKRGRDTHTRRDKRTVLPPRPAIGSSPGNTKAFLE